MERAVFIPTTDISLAKHCIDSFYKSQKVTNIPVFIVYTGADESVESRKINRNVIIVGYEHTSSVANYLSKIGNYPEKYIFGDVKFNRSYGGASNLIFALASILGVNQILKCDDDCLEHNDSSQYWLCEANQLQAKIKIIFFGDYLEIGEKPSDYIPKKTYFELIKYIYPSTEHLERIKTCYDKIHSIVKNGNLIVPKSAIKDACYPVLYDESLKIHGRGEVNYWKRQLESVGYNFIFKPKLNIKHKKNKFSLSSWISSLLLAFDLSFIDNKLHKGIFDIREKERIEKLSYFKSWMSLAEWGEDFDIFSVLNSIPDDKIFAFTEQYYYRKREAIVAWKQIMSTDLRIIANKLNLQF